MKSGIKTEPAMHRFFQQPLHCLHDVMAKNKVAALFQKRKAWIVEGTVPGCDQTTRMLISAVRGQRAYIIKMFFGSDYKWRCSGPHRLWQLISLNSESTKSYDVVVIGSRYQLTAFPPFRNAFCIPCWIDGCVDLRKNTEEFFCHSKNARYNLRRILKADFQVSYVNDLSSFNYFYYKMYRPYILNVYNDAAQIQGHDSLKQSYLDGGELLLLKANSQVIGGMLMLLRNDIAITHRLGILDGNIRTARNGAVSALFYYGMRRANALGYKKLRLGGSRSFLRDGLLRFKLDICNMMIDHYSTNAYFYIKFVKMSEGVRCFLINNPFICLDHGTMAIISFTQDLEDCRKVNRLKKSASRCKLARHRIYGIGEKDSQDACHFPSGLKCLQVTGQQQSAT